jgi:hypothetical protein
VSLSLRRQRDRIQVSLAAIGGPLLAGGTTIRYSKTPGARAPAPNTTSEGTLYVTGAPLVLAGKALSPRDSGTQERFLGPKEINITTVNPNGQ